MLGKKIEITVRGSYGDVLKEEEITLNKFFELLKTSRNVMFDTYFLNEKEMIIRSLIGEKYNVIRFKNGIVKFESEGKICKIITLEELVSFYFDMKNQCNIVFNGVDNCRFDEIDGYRYWTFFIE